MVTSRVLVEPNQFSSHTSAISVSRLRCPAGSASRASRSNSLARSATSSPAVCSGGRGVDDQVAEPDRLLGWCRHRVPRARRARQTSRPSASGPVAELVQRASQQLTELVRGELRLAQAEMEEKGRRYGKGGGLFGGAGMVGLLMLQALVATAIAALAVALPVWAAALIVTAALGVVAAAMAHEREEAGRQGGAARARASHRERQGRRGRDQGECAPMSKPEDEPTASSPEELRRQVEQTRAELGQTVEELADKADVKAGPRRRPPRSRSRPPRRSRS